MSIFFSVWTLFVYSGAILRDDQIDIRCAIHMEPLWASEKTRSLFFSKVRKKGEGINVWAEALHVHILATLS